MHILASKLKSRPIINSPPVSITVSVIHKIKETRNLCSCKFTAIALFKIHKHLTKQT